MPERATLGDWWSEKSAEAVLVVREDDEGLNGRTARLDIERRLRWPWGSTQDVQD